MKLSTDTPKGFLIQLLVSIVVLIAAILAFFYIYLPASTNHGETVTVPELKGIHMNEIEDFLLSRNLRYEINDSSYSEDYPPLTILKQYPKSGAKVKENRKIFISVNRLNPPTVPVPELVDRSLRNAEAVLKSNELKRGKILYQPSQFLNLVLEMQSSGQKISAGERIPKGSIIDLVVGNGCANCSFPAPNLVGNEMDDARFIILGSNLEMGMITLERDTTGRKSVVVMQEPAAGTKIRIGEAIDIWIAPKDASYEDDSLIDNE